MLAKFDNHESSLVDVAIDGADKNAVILERNNSISVWDISGIPLNIPSMQALKSKKIIRFPRLLFPMTPPLSQQAVLTASFQFGLPILQQNFSKSILMSALLVNFHSQKTTTTYLLLARTVN